MSMNLRKGVLILGTTGMRSPSLSINCFSSGWITFSFAFSNQRLTLDIWKSVASGRALICAWSSRNLSSSCQRETITSICILLEVVARTVMFKPERQLVQKLLSFQTWILSKCTIVGTVFHAHAVHTLKIFLKLDNSILQSQ